MPPLGHREQEQVSGSFLSCKCAEVMPTAMVEEHTHDIWYFATAIPVQSFRIRRSFTLISHFRPTTILRAEARLLSLPRCRARCGDVSCDHHIQFPATENSKHQHRACGVPQLRSHPAFPCSAKFRAEVWSATLNDALRRQEPCCHRVAWSARATPEPIPLKKVAASATIRCC